MSLSEAHFVDTSSWCAVGSADGHRRETKEGPSLDSSRHIGGCQYLSKG